MYNIFESIPISIRQQFCISDLFYKKIMEKDSPFTFFSSDAFTLLLIEKGSFSLCADNTYPLQQEQAFLLPPDVSMTLCPMEEENAFYFISFTGDLSKQLLEETLQKGNYLIGSDYYAIKKELKYLLALDQSAQLESFTIGIFSVLMRLYNHTTKVKTTPYPALVSSAIQLMEDNYTYLYGIEELAEQLEVSKHHLIRTFHEYMGISPGQYLTSIKIKNAKFLLESGESSMEVIAVSCGFSGADYFRKVFKKETGLSPKQFQKQNLTSKKASYPEELYL